MLMGRHASSHAGVRPPCRPGTDAAAPVYGGCQDPQAQGIRVTPEFSRNVSPDVEIALHPIPTPDPKPYIVTVGPDGLLWFCENGTAQIGRLDPDSRALTQFATPTADS